MEDPNADVRRLLAGLIAVRAVKKGSPPVPSMALEERRRRLDAWHDAVRRAL